MSFFKKTLIQIEAIKLFISTAREIMLFGGSRSGKSFIIIYAMIAIALKFAGSRQLIARFRFNHVKTSIWNDTLPKVLKLCFPGVPVDWNNTDYFIRFGNGSEIWITGIDSKERSEKILGMEFLNIFMNECSQIAYSSYELLKTRLAQLIEGARNQMFFDENPPSKKHWTYKVFIQKTEPTDNKPLARPEDYASMKMNPEHNVANISIDYMRVLDSMSNRNKKRFKNGEFADDTALALWNDAMIAKYRVRREDVPRFVKISVGVDPATTSKKDTSDETGIIVEGLGVDNHIYTLEDASDVYTPTEWALKAVEMYDKWKANIIVAETNQGGELVETMIKTVSKGRYIPYKGVHTMRDKTTRAEPVAAISEQGKHHMVGEHVELEYEMTTWEAKAGEKSPNRIDAKVYATAALIPSLLNDFKRPRSAA